MASVHHVTVGLAQAKALKKFMAPHMTSLDDLVASLGAEEAIKLYQLYSRLPDPDPEPKKKGK